MTETAPTLPELLRPRDAYRVLGISKQTFYQLDAAELIPAPITLGQSRWWRRAELAAWLEAGCPPRWDWKWNASIVVKVADLHAQRLREIADLERQAAELREQLERGTELIRMTAR